MSVSQEAYSGEQGVKWVFGVQLPRDCVSGTMPFSDCHWVALGCHNNGLQGVAHTTEGSFLTGMDGGNLPPKDGRGRVFPDALPLVCTLLCLCMSQPHLPLRVWSFQS